MRKKLDQLSDAGTDSASPDAGSESLKFATRIRTFLKGIIYYDNRSVSIDCTVRDISDTGARIVFSTVVNLPDNLELYIPQRQRTYSAQVRRRAQYEVGVSFEEQRSGEPRRTNDQDLAERVVKLENELASMNRLLKRLKDKVLPSDGEIK